MNVIRRVAWILGSPARALLIGSVRLYRVTLSGLLGGQCRFYPSCSGYAQEAIRTRGAMVGSVLAAWRILRCNPFGHGGPDPVPASAIRRVYEPVTRDGLSTPRGKGVTA